MLLKRATLDAIAAGEVDLQFRRWKRPTVKAGGTLTTTIGVLGVRSVEPTTLRQITAEEARRAGYPSRKALLEALEGRAGALYRIELELVGADPRLELREDRLDEPEARRAVEARLERIDRAAEEPWTRAYLELIARSEGVRAPELAQRVGLDTPRFKTRVRRLKALGLTESLKVGYRLSPRGRSLLGEGGGARGRSRLDDA